MNIKILDSWLREHLKTDAKPQKIAEIMSLTSVSIERLEKFKNDIVYDIEVTTNRADLMSVAALAKEASIVLPEHGVPAEFVPAQSLPINKTVPESPLITIKNDPKLVRRICAIIMNVTLKDSPQMIKDRLEAAGIRSLNNVIDLTNYIMLWTGQPTHVFDYDRLTTKKLIIRESKKGETLITLDKKKHVLPGGDIVADNGKGEIVDLLGIMGTANSVVTADTKRVLFFIDSVEPNHIRRTSMTLGIRTEAAVLNEKDIHPEIARGVLVHGIELFKKHASGNPVSDIIDIYPNPQIPKIFSIEKQKIASVIGVDIPVEKSIEILEKLGMKVTEKESTLEVQVLNAQRRKDITIPEDLIEEVARVYGYHNIPTDLAPIGSNHIAHYANDFYWENKIKNSFKYWGFTEVYTYAMVSENLFEGELKEAVTINNPLNEDMVYMRKTLVPSLLQVIAENKAQESIHIFELANVYHKRAKSLPDERLKLAGIVKKPRVSFFEVKGLFEQLAYDLGIKELSLKPVEEGSAGAEMYIGKDKLGEIEILDEETINFEADFITLINHATLHKVYTPLPKYPSIIEDMTFVLPSSVSFAEVVQTIKQQSKLVKDAVLIDSYQDNKTLRITYQHADKNLTAEDVAPVREKIGKTLKEKLHVGQK